MFDLLSEFRNGVLLASSQDTFGIIGSFLVVFSIPIVAIFTHHQRKMAEIIHRHQPPQVDTQIQQQLASMQTQIANLTSIVQEHIINNDHPATTSASVEHRLNQ